jgi:hypothetical protein
MRERSIQEAKPDLLLLHALKLSAALTRFVSTTNPIESLNSLLEEDLRRVKRWRDSEHFQRWLASAALANENRMRRVRGFKGIGNLAAAISALCAAAKPQVDASTKAAYTMTATQSRRSTSPSNNKFFHSRGVKN